MKSWPALLCVVALLSGCGSSRNVVTVQDATRITKGVELTDLQRALNAGAITAQEYETLRKAILRRPN